MKDMRQNVRTRDEGRVAGLRTWRLLLQHGQLEEKTVAERAMMHPKEARSLLYTLLKAGALQLQVLPQLGVDLVCAAAVPSARS